MQSLSDRLGRLEGSVRAWRCVTILLTVVLIATFTIAQAPSGVVDLVRCKKLEIINDEGKPAVAIKADFGKYGSVVTYGPEGKALVDLGWDHQYLKPGVSLGRITTHSVVGGKSSRLVMLDATWTEWGNSRPSGVLTTFSLLNRPLVRLHASEDGGGVEIRTSKFTGDILASMYALDERQGAVEVSGRDGARNTLRTKN